ncbi:DNA-binding response regulator [Paenibacillus sp. 598K]|uniref:helix-turn-helix domain-containing protein n=1 Tax=Paenibacillus sp. 598K TaxID=1117987 RepID=UPI000FFA79D8|nr:helix-turn-helix domain-containing protein [Paenibacillus sp. 598K]GBF76785.1 DNA-binding response regulator [Paenibacillus sp. 598K]
MYRLLIVDNEPNIVRGLKQLFAEEAPYELEVHGVLSAEEALRLMQETQIDIALLDIRMPGMNGLELQAEMAKRWPRCRAVFLSGYDDFAYIQTAMRGGGTDYVLKMDGDDAILRAVGKAIAHLEQADDREQLLERARTQWNQSLGARQSEYVRELLHGLATARTTRFEELELPLDADSAVLLLVGRIDGFAAEHSESDKALLRYAVQNIAGEHWQGYRQLAAQPEPTLLMTLIQAVRSTDDTPVDASVGTPVDAPNDTAEDASVDAPNAAADEAPVDAECWQELVHTRLEAIQSACRRYLKLSVSFAASAGPIAWTQLPAKLAELKRMLFFGFGADDGTLLTDAFNRNFDAKPPSQPDETVARHKLRRLLSTELGMEQRLLDDFDELAELSRQTIRSRRFHAELYHGVCYLLLSSEESSAGDEGAPTSAEEPLLRLLSLDEHESWDEALAYLRGALVRFIESRHHTQEEGAAYVVQKLKTFIETHLHEDLSLVRLAGIVYLNPTYLSRLFKQQTGQGVSEHIARLRLDKSKELLRYSSVKIQEIAGKVGFDSATSFGRFFKREAGLTPQDYRDAESTGRV